MPDSNALKVFLFWFIVIAAGFWYFVIYQPSHPPKPSIEEISKENKFKADRAYREDHPEENKYFAILSAKYGVSVKSVQTVIHLYHSSHRFELKNKQEFLIDIANKAGISQQIVAAILIDYSYLTSDCSQPESEE